jgi:hypothetical protein
MREEMGNDAARPQGEWIKKRLTCGSY